MQPGDVLAGRYELLAELGAGAMGVVYRAHDRERNAEIAIKTLKRPEATFLFRLKQEFRALAGLVHPNLVRLHDLVADGEVWLLTMELVEGVPFTEFVRADPERLRPALAELVRAVAALHRAGKLHRDIKPANVLVTPAGRVVLLDFGLATDLAVEHVRPESLDGVFGTPSYMAPEQLDGSRLSAASDWYAVGALLFEALTGCPAFDGSWVEIVLAKHRSDERRPSRLVAGVPADLDDLTAGLLARSPQQRPGERALVALLAGVEAAPVADAPHPTRPAGEGAFVGRHAELARLAARWSSVRRTGRPEGVLVRGDSGVGKSALVRELLARTSGPGAGVLALAGRCHERESVPFKAVDPIVDELSRYLRALAPSEAAALVPSEIGALVRAFPALRRVEAVAAAPRRGAEAGDAQELRRRATTALRELLTRIALRRPTVVWIDDLQWCDADGAAMWLDVLRAPDGPPLLWIGCHARAAETQAPGFAVLEGGLREALPGAVDVMDLEPLGPADAEALARAILPEGAADAQVSEVVRDGDGNPFFLWTLARSLAEHTQVPRAIEADGSARSGAPSLGLVLRERIAALPAGARRVLETVAVASRPIPEVLALRAAGLGTLDLDTLRSLQDQHWVRSVGAAAPTVETYHERIRQAALTGLSEAKRAALHGRLAELWIAAGNADPAQIADHLRCAGRVAEAAGFLEAGAQRATEALAFENAATLLRLALEVAGEERRAALEVALGEALANAGKGSEAADVFLAASARPGTADALALRWKASEQWLRAGHVDRGLAVASEVLTSMGMPPPRTPRRALARLLLERARLAISETLGSRHRVSGPASEGSEPPWGWAPEKVTPFSGRGSGTDPRKTMDICHSFAAAMGLVDPVLGACYQVRQLRLARRFGDPERSSRALALDAAYRAALGDRHRARALATLASAETLASEARKPEALGFVRLMAAIVAHQQGEWRRSLHLVREARATFEARCVGTAWEQVNARRLELTNLYWTGAWDELAEQAPRVLVEAEQRGNRYEARVVRGFFAVLAHLARGRTDEAHRAVAESERESETTVRLFDVYAVLGVCTLDLYRNEPSAAWQRLRAVWPRLQRAQLLRITAARILLLDLRARTAVACAARSGASDRERFLRAARRDAQALERLPVRWPRSLAAVVRAGLATSATDSRAPEAFLQRALVDFESLGMGLHAHATRHRLGIGPRAESAGLAGLDDARWFELLVPSPTPRP